MRMDSCVVDFIGVAAFVIEAHLAFAVIDFKRKSPRELRLGLGTRNDLPGTSTVICCAQ